MKRKKPAAEKAAARPVPKTAARPRPEATTEGADAHGASMGGAIACPLPGGGKMRRLHDRCDEHPHWCFPLNEPVWVKGAGARHMRKDDPVVGIHIDGKSWALPWWILKNHHVANLTLAGKPIMVMFCEVCTGAAAFDPVIDGKRHMFKLGGLYNGTGMPMDLETETMWTGFSGLGMEGPLTGCTMERFPIFHCTWQEWLGMHPDSLVPDGAGESREGHGEGQTPGSPFVGQYMTNLLSHLDTRLPYYELVLGVRAGADDATRCYPLAKLRPLGGVLNDTLGGEDIVVLARPGTWMAVAYGRRVDDRVLTFKAGKGGMVDDETGSFWNMDGLAVSGPMHGRKLKYVFSGVEEYFLWAAFNPQTEVFGVASDAGMKLPAKAILDSVPLQVQTALEAKWFRPGMSLLVLNIRDGLVPAFLAEVGCKVLAIDADEKLVQAARERFRGVVRLRYERADLRKAKSPGVKFDGVLDLGYLTKLPAAQRAACVANLAGICKHGARLMVLTAIKPDQMEARRTNMEKLFAPAFKLLDGKAAGKRGAPAGAQALAAFRFQRT